MTSDILSFIHCAACVRIGRSDRLKIGLTDPFTMRVWCQKCDKIVADFTLAHPIEPRCDVCGEAINSPHHKH